jgi:hypothetical protein
MHDSRSDPQYSCLQWGHGITAVEILELGSSSLAELSRFNGATASLPWKWAALKKPRRVFVLQWGHGITAVEMRRASRGRRRRASMGPRHHCRGNCVSCGLAPPGARCFNGATASLPWKSGHLTRTSIAAASMGPRHHCRGNDKITMGTQGLTLVLRFNGATASLPWKSKANARSDQ